MSNLFGKRLKFLREDRQIPQRFLAAALEIDTATYCKIEKGIRRAKKEQVISISDLLQTDSKELFKLWSADKICEIIEDEDNASQILDVVAENISIYQKKKKYETND
jgi:transcriptional regulator with XRE-family HTH domain